jgi:linoleoyl-CoA desaturase
VNNYLKEKPNHQYANGYMLCKIFFCVLLYAGSFALYINPNLGYPQWLMCSFLFGFANMLVGVNIAHDAIHNALFRKKWLNGLAGFSFDLIGISSYTWKLKHNYLHHNYPNVLDVDLDIDASPILRFSPADKKRWFHRYQHFYAPLIYLFFSLHLVFINDILIFSGNRIPATGNKKFRGLQVFIQKSIYLFLILFLPILILPFPWWQVLSGFLLMHFTLSLFLALVLLPSHLFEHTSFSETNEQGGIAEDWTLHQLSTTLDFASQNRLVHFLCGGFNTNVVHHLFPSICHCHYRGLSKIIAEKARELELPYHHKSLGAAIGSHFKMIKQLGQ